MQEFSVRPMCRVLAAGLVLALAGCAGSGAPTTVAPAPTVAALPTGASGGSQRGVGLEVSTRVEGQQASLAADAGAVFSALEASYEMLQISLSRRDPQARVIGNDGLKMRRELGKLQLRKAFDCGGTSGMPNSETYTITASIISSVSAQGDNAAVLTTVIDASAENPNFPGSGVRCSSTGVIESAIEKEVRARLNSR